MEPTFAYARASSNRSSRSTAYAPFKPFQAKTGFKRSKVPVVPGSGPVPQPKIGKRETSASSHIARADKEEERTWRNQLTLFQLWLRRSSF